MCVCVCVCFVVLLSFTLSPKFLSHLKTSLLTDIPEAKSRKTLLSYILLLNLLRVREREMK